MRHVLRELLDLDPLLVEDQLARASVTRQIEDAVAPLVLELAEVVLQLLLGVARQVAEADVVDARGQLEERHDAETALDVAVPKRLDARDVLLPGPGPSHRLSVSQPPCRYDIRWHFRCYEANDADRRVGNHVRLPRYARPVAPDVPTRPRDDPDGDGRRSWRCAHRRSHPGCRRQARWSAPLARSFRAAPRGWRHPHRRRSASQ